MWRQWWWTHREGKMLGGLVMLPLRQLPQSAFLNRLSVTTVTTTTAATTTTTTTTNYAVSTCDTASEAAVVACIASCLSTITVTTTTHYYYDNKYTRQQQLLLLLLLLLLLQTMVGVLVTQPWSSCRSVHLQLSRHHYGNYYYTLDATVKTTTAWVEKHATIHLSTPLLNIDWFS